VKLVAVDGWAALDDDGVRNVMERDERRAAALA
jgi:hypothetical protein